jgi:precorrin-2 dehydrogenase/sirohydrochlorin ferrochelatase
MANCPMFLNLKGRKILILGGGEIATRKLKVLLDFTNDITVISRSFSDEMQKLTKDNGLKNFKKEYKQNDIEGFNILIVAFNDIELQKQIAKQVQGKNYLCNFADLPENCDFNLGAYLKKEDLIISISTNGGAPSVITQLKLWLDKKIPNSVIDFIKEIKKERSSLPKGEERMKYLRKKTKDFFDKLD